MASPYRSTPEEMFTDEEFEEGCPCCHSTDGCLCEFEQIEDNRYHCLIDDEVL